MGAGRLGGVVVALLLAGCGQKAPTGPTGTCEARRPAMANAGTAPRPIVVPPSRVLVEVRVDTEAMLRSLEKAVPKRVAERKGVSMGDAGKLDFSVDRGPFDVSLAGDQLSLAVDLEGDARLCKPMGPVCVPYASCKPAARGRAEVSLVLGSSYKLAGSRVEIPITRRCTLTALEVDVTRDLEAEATARATQIRDGIDAAVPVVEPLLRDTWRALGTSIAIGKDTCARIAPTGIVQTGPRLHDGAIRIGVGAEGEVRVERPCRPATPSGELPRPTLARDAKPGLSLRFPAVVGWEEASRAVAQRAIGEHLTVDGASAKVTDASIAPDGEGVRIRLTVVGPVCGEIALTSPTVNVDPTRGAFTFALAAPQGVDAGALASRLVVPLPVELAGMDARIDRVARGLFSKDALDPETATLVVKVAPPRVTSAGAAEEGLFAVVSAEGEAAVVLQPVRAP